LRKAVSEADRVLRKLNGRGSRPDLFHPRVRVTGLRAVFHVAEHFSHHAGQIVLLTKYSAKGLKFTPIAREEEERKRREYSGPVASGN